MLDGQMKDVSESGRRENLSIIEVSGAINDAQDCGVFHLRRGVV